MYLSAPVRRKCNYDSDRGQLTVDLSPFSNTVIYGPQKSGRINGMAILKGLKTR